jgi:hypothetical protein
MSFSTIDNSVGAAEEESTELSARTRVRREIQKLAVRYPLAGVTTLRLSASYEQLQRHYMAQVTRVRAVAQ